MRLLKFELKKVWKQKKLLWLLLLVVIGTVYIFQHNASQQDNWIKRAYEKTEPLSFELDQLIETFEKDRIDGNLNETGMEQLDQLKRMRSALYSWRGAIHQAKWRDVPPYEKDFLDNLQLVNESGIEYSALQGMQRDIAIQKNAWLIKHDLPYEDEMYPMSPHLLLKESTSLFWSILGIAMLLLLFGNTITIEMEQKTWLTIKTQPITKRKLIASKFFSLFVVWIAFVVMVIGIGLLVLFPLSDYSLNLQYPQVVVGESTFVIISTLSYLTRAMGFFFCAGILALSLCLFIGNWLKNSFSTIIITFLILFLGVFITNSTPFLQTVINPFHFFRFSQLLEVLPKNTDWIYSIAAIIWSGLFLALAAVLPDKELGLVRGDNNKKPFKHGETHKQRQGMWSLITFEWRKLRRKGIFKQVSVLLIFLVAIGYFSLSQQAKQREVEYFDGLLLKQSSIENNEIPYIKQLIDFAYTELRIAEKENDEWNMFFYKEQVDGFEKLLTLMNENKLGIEDAVAGFEKKDWNRFYAYQLFENRYANGELDIDGIHYNDWKRSLGQFTVDVSIAEKLWLIERNLQPIFPGEYVPTIYHQWGEYQEERKAWEAANRKVDDSGLFSLHLLFDNYLYLLPMMLFLFLLGGGFAAERGKKTTLHLLQTQPIATKRIYVGKVFHSSFLSVISCLGLFGLVVLVGTMFNRFGDWNYPILHYDNPSLANSDGYTGTLSVEKGFHFIPLGDYLVASIVLFLLTLLFLVALTHFISLFFYNALGVFATPILIAAVGFVLSNRYLSDFVHLSPFTYLNLPKVMNGEVSSLLDHSVISFQTGSLVLIISTLVLISSGYIVLVRKNKKR